MSPDSRTDIRKGLPVGNLPRKTIALVVPSLAEGGGVPAVARFVKDTILCSGRYDLELVSLSVSAYEFIRQL